MRSRAPTLVVALVTLYAGCVGPGEPLRIPAPSNPGPDPTAAFLAPQIVMGRCAVLRGVNCFEGTIAAALDGTLFASPLRAESILALRPDSSSWESLRPPPMPPPAPPGTQAGDVTLLVDARGRLWLTAIAYPPEVPGGQATAGLLVSRSDDGGRSWALNMYLSPLSLSPNAAFATDRQWLSVGADGVAYLSYWQWVGQNGVWVSRSADDGRTWGPFSRVVKTEERGFYGFSGQGAVLDAGRFVMPYYASEEGLSRLDSGTPAVRVALSNDAQTWTHVTVATMSSGRTPSSSYPQAAADEAGRVHVVWTETGGRVLVSSTDDAGRTWSPPIAWNGNRTQSVVIPAWIQAHDDMLNVVWYEQADGGQRIRHARAPIGTQPAASSEAAFLEFADRTTDFAHFAVEPDGRVAVVFTDPSKGLQVVREKAHALR